MMPCDFILVIHGINYLLWQQVLWTNQLQNFLIQKNTLIKDSLDTEKREEETHNTPRVALRVTWSITWTIPHFGFNVLSQDLNLKSRKT